MKGEGLYKFFSFFTFQVPFLVFFCHSGIKQIKKIYGIIGGIIVL